MAYEHSPTDTQTLTHTHTETEAYTQPAWHTLLAVAVCVF